MVALAQAVLRDREKTTLRPAFKTPENGSSGRPKQNCQYSVPSSARRPSSE
jgi:hypothetical protein